MNLDRIQIKPRLRNAWEAIDLGFVIARAWWQPLMLSWLLPALVVFLVLSILLAENNFLAFMLTWWLKPIFDRGPLYIASRRLFGESVGVADTLRILHKLYFQDVFAWLLWRRLSLTRSYDMPITILENLTGEKRRKRLLVLHQQASNAAAWLTVACVHMEMIIVFGIFGLVVLLVPEQSDIHWMSVYSEDNLLTTVVINIFSFVAMSLVAPFYVMAGFSLYLNRRISLEAWDIEIRFRHMAEKFKKNIISAAAISLLMAGLVLQCLPQPAMAVQQEILTPDQAGTVIQEIMSGEDFTNKIPKSGWRLKDFEEKKVDENEVPEWLLNIIRFLESLGSEKTESAQLSLANIIEIILWIGAAIMLLVIARWLYRYKHVLMPKKFNRVIPGEDAMPETLFGLDVRKDSLPEDITAQVMRYWVQSKQRDAIGLLYRAMLSQLVHKFAFRFNQANTEMECVAMVQASNHDSIKRYVRQLTTVWQQIAYAHTLPDDEKIHRLCTEWKLMERHEI